MAKNFLHEFVPASTALPTVPRASHGKLKFIRLTTNGIALSSALKRYVGDSVNVLIHPSKKHELAIVHGHDYQIGKMGDTWMLLRSSTLARQLEAVGWDRKQRNYAEAIEGGVLITQGSHD